MPLPGAKNRETKSTPVVAGAARHDDATRAQRAQAPEVGRETLQHVFAVDFDEIVEPAETNVYGRRDTKRVEHVLQAPPRAQPASRGSRARSSRRKRVADRRPLFVSKRATEPRSNRSVSHRACAAASVACPHRSTSTVGVNHLRSNASGPATTNAVSARFISAATLCIQLSAAGRASRQHRRGISTKRLRGECVDLEKRHGHGDDRIAVPSRSRGSFGSLRC